MVQQKSFVKIFPSKTLDWQTDNFMDNTDSSLLIWQHCF